MFGESVFGLIPDHEVRAAKLTNRWISGCWWGRESLAAWMAANVVTNGTGSALLVRALRLPSQQDARVPLPAYGDDYNVSMDLTAELAGIIDVSEEEARLHAQAW